MSKTIKIEVINEGEEVWCVYMKSFPSMVTCGTCGGEGVLFSKAGKKIECIECKGKKKIEGGGALKYVTEKKLVHKVNVEICDSIGISYGLIPLDAEKYNRRYDYSDTYHESSVFLKKKDARTYCDEMNNKCSMGYTSLDKS